MDVSPRVQVSISLSSVKHLLRFKQVSSQVQASIFLSARAYLLRDADYRQQVC